MFEKNMKMKKVNNDDDANDRQWTHFVFKSSRAFGSGELPISLVRKMFCFVGFFYMVTRNTCTIKSRYRAKFGAV